MLKKARRNTNARELVRLKRKTRIRRKLATQKEPAARIVVFRSNRFLYAQLVDDQKGHTLAQANTREKSFAELSSRKGKEAAQGLGKLIAERAKEKKVERVVFDRNGYDYHGKVKAIADGAREAGLRF